MRSIKSGSGPYGFKYEVEVAGEWIEYVYRYQDKKIRDRMYKDRNAPKARNVKKFDK